jgi:hypothetical protein
MTCDEHAVIELRNNADRTSFEGRFISDHGSRRSDYADYSRSNGMPASPWGRVARLGGRSAVSFVQSGVMRRALSLGEPPHVATTLQDFARPAKTWTTSVRPTWGDAVMRDAEALGLALQTGQGDLT